MRASRQIAARVSAIYAAVAVLWILTSDRLAAMLPTPLEIAVQTGKGLFFVGTTALVLYYTVLRYADRIERKSIEVENAERMLSQVVGTTPVGMLITNEEGLVTYLNPAAQDLLGIDASEAVGNTLEELCCGDDADLAVGFGELLRTGAVDGLMIGRAREGVPLATVARAAQLDPEHPGVGLVIALADVTDSHRATMRSERLLTDYRFLAEALVRCSKAADPRTLLVQIAELAVEKGGYHAAWAMLREHSGEPFRDVATVNMGEASQETIGHMMRRAADDPKHVLDRLASGRFMLSNDVARNPADPWYAAALSEGFGSIATFGVTTPDGAFGTITFIDAEPGRFDAAELDMMRTLQGAMGFALSKMALDEERLKAEEALERAEQGYEDIFKNHPEPMYIWDRETYRFLDVNQAALRKYGYSEEQFLAMSVLDIRPASEIEMMKAESSSRPGLHDAGVWTHVDASGRQFPVQVYSHNIQWNGRPAENVLALEVARV